MEYLRNFWGKEEATFFAATHPKDEDTGPARRRRQLEWYREQVEKEEARRVQDNLSDYDLDVCMISHFHDGAPAHNTRKAHMPGLTRRTRCTRMRPACYGAQCF